MKTLSGKEFAKILGRKGWKLSRIKGSHYIYVKEGRKENISLPIHKNKALKSGLQRYFMKVANIDESEL